jgi:hypothetical protein
MLDISKLTLTQPSLAGSGAELGNKTTIFLQLTMMENYFVFVQ